VRIPAASVSCIGRNTQGVRMITTDAGDRVSSVAAIVPDDDEEETVETAGEVPEPAPAEPEPAEDEDGGSDADDAEDADAQEFDA